MSFIEEKGVIKYAAHFLGVSPESLEKSLCTKTTLTRGETIVSPLSASQARDVCDAFVKGIYGRMFIWIVTKINQVIFKPKVISHYVFFRFPYNWLPSLTLYCHLCYMHASLKHSTLLLLVLESCSARCHSLDSQAEMQRSALTAIIFAQNCCIQNSSHRWGWNYH